MDNHETMCPERQIECLLGCGLVLKRGDYIEHRRSKCPNNFVNIKVKASNHWRSTKGVRELFEQFGHVLYLKCLYVGGLNRKQRSRCFVAYDSPEVAHKAVIGLNGARFQRSRLSIEKAVERLPVVPMLSQEPSSHSFDLYSLPSDYTEESLVDFFSNYGIVLGISLHPHRCIYFTNEAEVDAAKAAWRELHPFAYFSDLQGGWLIRIIGIDMLPRGFLHRLRILMKSRSRDLYIVSHWRVQPIPERGPKNRAVRESSSLSKYFESKAEKRLRRNRGGH